MEEVGCSTLGDASVQKLGHSALYRSLHSAPAGVGRTQGTHTERENAADRELVVFLRSEIMLRGRKKVIFSEEQGMLRSLRADLGIQKQRRKFVLAAAVYEPGVCVLLSQPRGEEFCSTLTTLPPRIFA